MKNYLDLLKKIIETGIDSDDRTGVGTRSLFGEQLRFDLSAGFPAVTTKKLAWKSMVSELLWFIEGSRDERRLAEIQYGTRDTAKTTIWTANAQADYWIQNAQFDGDLGRVYGVQWRDWRTPVFNSSHRHTSFDQLKSLIENIKKDPFSRRHILMSYNPGEINLAALPPCHMMAQFYVRGDRLSCQMYQRSADVPLGTPFNIASYSLLTHMIAQVCGLSVGELIVVMGDCHIYKNQIEGVEEQLSRDPLPLPTLWLNPEIDDITKFKIDDMRLVNYQPLPTIKFPFAT